MRKTILAGVVVATFSMLTARAQDRSTLDAAAKAMGALTSIQYSGTGTNNAFGQAYGPTLPWPAFKVTNYTVTINYPLHAMRVELERTNPDGPGPARGGGGLPLLQPQKTNQAVNNRTAWNVNATPAPGAYPAAPAQGAVNARLQDLWTTPHGVLIAAQANNATVAGKVVSFTLSGVPIKVTLDAGNLVSKVETRADAAVVGDTVTETTYSLYKDYNGVKFPTRIVTRQGGFPILDITVTEVKVNTSLPSVDVPANVAQAFAANPAPAAGAAPAPPPPPMVTTTKVADGVYYLTGGTHHSMAVEFADYSVLFETPNNDARALAVIEATKKAIPNKPIRYVVNSHNHFDHLGGVRAAMAEGLTIITQAQNKPYYEKIATMPHTITPDRLAMSPKPPMIETVLEKRVLTDATQTLELYRLPTDHSSTMLIGYLPKAKILYEVDVFNGPAVPNPNAPPPAPAPINPATVAFYDQIQKMKLDVNQILAGHGGRIATMADLRAAVGKPGVAD